MLLRPDASAEDIERIRHEAAAFGAEAHVVRGGGDRRALAVTGAGSPSDGARLAALPGVDEVFWGGSSYHLASREWQPERTIIRLPGDVALGGDEVVIVAGPCAVEDATQLMTCAAAAAAAGARLLRGGAYKPRSSPYAFQGLGHPALELLARARQETGLRIVTEVMDTDAVEPVARVADVLQIGARNMGNYSLLRHAARTGKPILLKRGIAATIQEFLLAAEYVLAEGNPHVILCERGIRGFDGSTRNVFDLAAIPLLRQLTHLPVVADPSHGTGRRDLVPAMARAAVAAGADGVMIEIHPDPDRARSDAAQTIEAAALAGLVAELRAVAAAVGRPCAPPRPRLAPEVPVT